MGQQITKMEQIIRMANIYFGAERLQDEAAAKRIVDRINEHFFNFSLDGVHSAAATERVFFHNKGRAA